jgi:hypothetical protein
MKNIPTAKEFCYQKYNEISPLTFWIEFNEMVMIEFAKLHVEAALKAKIEKMNVEYSIDYSINELDAFTQDAYPLTNIK